jgi:hypothetical protein
MHRFIEKKTFYWKIVIKIAAVTVLTGAIGKIGGEVFFNMLPVSSILVIDNLDTNRRFYDV